MKLTTRLRLTARLSIESATFRNISLFSLLALIYLTLGIGRASGAQLIWDPLNNGGNAPANGNWDTTAGNKVWAPGNVPWSQTSTTVPLNGATFGGADGAWSVVLDVGQIAANNVTVNNSGYTISGANTLFLPANSTVTVAAGKTATFNCNFSGSSAQFWTLGSGATMNVGGNMAGAQYRLAGADPTSTFNLTGVNSFNQLYVLGSVNLTAGSLTTSSAGAIGYPTPQTINGVSYTSGTLTVGGGASTATFTPNGNFLFVGREFNGLGGQGTLTILNNGIVNAGTATAKSLAICYDGGAQQSLTSGTESGTVNVNGGTLNVGTTSLASPIYFFQTGCYLGETATMTQTAGTVNAWGGISFGSAQTFYAGGVATLTQSGGTLYIGGGVNGIIQGSGFTPPNTFSITLSGGTVGALANWSSLLPITLGTANGNITFQCAEAGSAPHNISLSGALTGAGGLNVTGGGTLTLSGANNYAGSTVVSNGTLAIVTGPSPITNGPVTLDGGAGSPTVTVQSSPGQYWTNNGMLTFQNGTTTASFQFGALSPSTTVAPLRVSGNVAFTATPIVNVGGSAIPLGTFPLIKYTGSISGSMPTSVTTWTGGTASAGYITNITATKTIALVVTSSTYNPALSWRVGNGVWDINTTPNWKQFGNPTNYTDGNAVIFDDTASGSSPITVTLNTTVNPLAVTANNAAKNYLITGTGSIAGSSFLQVLGSGTVTLNGTNSYNGGTVISAGQLNINNGGDNVNGTAIGTGTFTINGGATVDNTSGSDVTLQASIPETWNGNFTYLGSANGFNTGAGAVTLGNSLSIAVNSNAFTVGGAISDSGLNYAVTKTGNGALTLPVGNSFGGGLTLSSGQLNLGDTGAAGFGIFTIAGGAIDNISGAGFNMTPASYVWSGNFSFLGTTNLGLFGTVFVPAGSGSITVNVVSNTLSTFGDITSGNTTIIKSGPGTWNLAGSSSGANNLGLVVSAGQVKMAKASGNQSIGVGTIGLTVQANALAIDGNSFQVHSGTPSTPVPVTLSGGVWDLNSWSENVDKLFISNGGTLRNGAAASTSTLTLISGFSANLSGTNCQFDVTAVDGNLNFNGIIAGSGSLVKTGAGVLNLNSNNTYTGNTTVGGGTLALSFPCLASTAAVSVATNAILQLNFAATNTVAALVLNGASKPAGIYNVTTDPTYLAGTGSLQISSSIPTNPTNLTFSVSGNTLSLSWPSNYVGWILQTNVAGLTVGSGWHDVPGSATNTQLSVPLTNSAITSEFFRLRYP